MNKIIFLVIISGIAWKILNFDIFDIIILFYLGSSLLFRIKTNAPLFFIGSFFLFMVTTFGGDAVPPSHLARIQMYQWWFLATAIILELIRYFETDHRNRQQEKLKMFLKKYFAQLESYHLEKYFVINPKKLVLLLATIGLIFFISDLSIFNEIFFSLLITLLILRIHSSYIIFSGIILLTFTPFIIIQSNTDVGGTYAYFILLLATIQKMREHFREMSHTTLSSTDSLEHS